MLEKLNLSVAQPQLDKLSFRDITPLGSGGWGTISPPVAGDYQIEDCVGWKITLEHHEIGSFGAIIRNMSLYDNLFLMANEIAITEFNSLDYDKYPDGIYIVKYMPFDSNGDELIPEDFQSMILVIGQSRVEFVKNCLKYNKTTKLNTKNEIKRIINDFLVEAEVCKSLVIVDNYTLAVESFKRLETIVSEGKGLL